MNNFINNKCLYYFLSCSLVNLRKIEAIYNCTLLEGKIYTVMDIDYSYSFTCNGITNIHDCNMVQWCIMKEDSVYWVVIDNDELFGYFPQKRHFLLFLFLLLQFSIDIIVIDYFHWFLKICFEKKIWWNCLLIARMLASNLY